MANLMRVLGDEVGKKGGWSMEILAEFQTKPLHVLKTWILGCGILENWNHTSSSNRVVDIYKYNLVCKVVEVVPLLEEVKHVVSFHHTWHLSWLSFAALRQLLTPPLWSGKWGSIRQDSCKRLTGRSFRWLCFKDGQAASGTATKGTRAAKRGGCDPAVSMCRIVLFAASCGCHLLGT